MKALPMEHKRFDFYGTEVVIQSASSSLLTHLQRDFSYFLAPEKGHDSSSPRAEVEIKCFGAAFPDSCLPAIKTKNIQPRCVVYAKGDEKWVSYYHGRAMTFWNAATERAEVWSEDEALLHEITYLLVLSRVGELHDRKGIHRVHAAGLSIDGRGYLCLLPSGCGKTTLTWGALSNKFVDILSDDTPLITRQGKILAFPTRFSFCGNAPINVDERYIRSFNRAEHGPKFLVDIEAFGDRVVSSAVPTAVIVGTRKLKGKALIRQIPRHQALKDLFSCLVVGVGLPQLIEYFLRADALDIFRKAHIVASRILTCVALLVRAKTYVFELGPNVEENTAVFNEFLLDAASRQKADNSALVS